MARKKPRDTSPGDIPRSFDPSTGAENYTRIEAKIPMRDGVELFTLILIPKGVKRRMPIILTRTPYNAAGRASTASPDIAMVVSAADAGLVRDGYIRAYQDVRGRFGSKGKYTMTMAPRGPYNDGDVDQTTDAWDTIEWLVDNVEGNNGRVGITGTSYDGLLTLMALLDPHPALKAAVPVNAMVDSWLGDDFYRHGAFRLAMLQYVFRQTSSKNASHNIRWGHYDFYQAVLEAGSIGELGKKVGADKLRAWKRLLAHPAYDDYWQDQALQRQLEEVSRRVPTLVVHSLFDAEDLYGSVLCHETLSRHETAAAPVHLAIGPWSHGQASGDGAQLGHLKWGSDTSRQFRQQLLKPFWDRHLKGVKPKKALPKVWAFETGTNEWGAHTAWPPRRSSTRRLYLHEGGGLSFDKPKGADSSTAYISDPAKPVPYQVRPIPPPFTGDMPSTWYRWLADDQRPFSDRPDVVAFVSAPLDESLTVSGPVAAVLHAATTGTDADWVVKLIDLYPNEVPGDREMGGYQLMVSGDILRGRYRESYEAAAPIPSGQVLSYRIEMPHVNHTFLPGHRLMVHVQSTWFPVCDRNPQTFVEDIAWAQAGDFQAATHSIYHGVQAASHIELPGRR
ncbi:MAG: CocE/NonD family hydrolase [Candidatus Latescibacteria bacterium]|nr:CocE/NonD family hydrolase [Candidatus Latescibacterota bacterium]